MTSSLSKAKYLATVDPSTLPPAGSLGFDTSARATPDVSLLAEGYQLIAGGKVMTVGGTSAAAPAFAALVSLLNDARAAGGKPPMGFLNPFLYSEAAIAANAFTDITVGSNKRDRSGTPWSVVTKQTNPSIQCMHPPPSNFEPALGHIQQSIRKAEQPYSRATIQ